MIAAGPEHAAALAAIHTMAFADDPWDAASFSSLLRQPGVAGFLDPRGGLVLLRVVADEAEILTIGVAARRQGIGRALMAAAITHVTARDVAILHLEVAAANVAARGLYAAFGFEPTGSRPRYYPDGDDAVILSLRIEAE